MCILKADTLYKIAFFSRCRDFGVLLEKQFGALYTAVLRRKSVGKLHERCKLRERCFYFCAESYLTCRVVTKGIKADCNCLMRTCSAKP